MHSSHAGLPFCSVQLSSRAGSGELVVAILERLDRVVKLRSEVIDNRECLGVRRECC